MNEIQSNTVRGVSRIAHACAGWATWRSGRRVGTVRRKGGGPFDVPRGTPYRLCGTPPTLPKESERVGGGERNQPTERYDCLDPCSVGFPDVCGNPLSQIGNRVFSGFHSGPPMGKDAGVSRGGGS